MEAHDVGYWVYILGVACKVWSAVCRSYGIGIKLKVEIFKISVFDCFPDICIASVAHTIQ